MQCAWCRRLYDDAGPIGDPQPSLLPRISHGVCHTCADRILRDEAARHRGAGDVALALRLERERLALQVDLARQRCLARAGRVKERVGRSNTSLARSRDVLAHIVDAVASPQ